MVESDEGSNARQIKAARVKIGPGGLSCKCQVLLLSIPIHDGAGLIGFINVIKAFAGMEKGAC